MGLCKAKTAEITDNLNIILLHEHMRSLVVFQHNEGEFLITCFCVFAVTWSPGER